MMIPTLKCFGLGSRWFRSRRGSSDSKATQLQGRLTTIDSEMAQKSPLVAGSGQGLAQFRVIVAGCGWYLMVVGNQTTTDV